MTRCLSTAALLVLACSSFRPALASARQLPDSVRAGTPVAVVDEAGNQTEGRVDGISGDLIRIKRRGKIEEIPIERIVRIEKTDSLKNGALNGLAVGGTLGLTAVISAASGSGGPDLGFAVWAVGGNILIYTALGVAIDGMIQGKRTLYERGGSRETRIAPIVAPGVRGAAIRVSW